MLEPGPPVTLQRYCPGRYYPSLRPISQRYTLLNLN